MAITSFIVLMEMFDELTGNLPDVLRCTPGKLTGRD